MAHDDGPSLPAEVYATLPTKHVAAGAVFRDDEGRVLLVKPTYKEPWDIPGGGVEADESPLEGCRREILEELGLGDVPLRFLGIDHRRTVEGIRGDALRFVFDGGVLSANVAAAIRLPPDELREWRFVALDDLDEFVIPVQARRLRNLVAASSPTYLEEGHVVAPPASLDLFAEIHVRDFSAAKPWYVLLLGEPAFVAHETEEVWELAEHRYIAVEEQPEHAGHSAVTLFVDDLDAAVDAITARGIEPTTRETYGNGVRKVTFHDPDGNEIGFGGAPL